MSARKMNVVLRTMALSIIFAVLLVACSTSESPSRGEQVKPQPTGSETTKFDGSWRTDCFKDRLFNVPEDAQPDGYVQTTLNIDSTTKTYSNNRRKYTDSQCTIANPDDAGRIQSGKFRFDGVTTTISGLEATIVRYFFNGTVSDLIGLLYRDGDILYVEQRESTLIEDIVPNQLSLGVAWRLVN